MEKTKQREGNFELLRIIAMILIIFHHYAYHGNLMGVNEAGINAWIGRFIYIGGKLGVHLFILITGYYMIDSKFKIKKLLKIILETIIYSAGVELFFVYVLKNQQDPIDLITNYWFVNAYIAVYLCSPFLNKLLKTCTRKEVHIFIIILLILLKTWVKTDILTIIFMYIIGAYIKLYNFDFKKPKMAKWYAILGYTVIFISMFVRMFINDNFIEMYYAKWAEIRSIPLMFVSISMFLWFKNLKIKNNKIIQSFAASSFAVYLLHDNIPNRSNLWWGLLKADRVYFLNPLLVIAHIVICTMIIYITAVILEFIRVNLIEKPIFKIKFFDKYLEKIDELVNIS